MVYEYSVSVRVCVCVLCALVSQCQDKDLGVRAEVFPPPPHGRERCKTQAPVACCGNAGQSQLFSASASHEVGYMSHFPDVSVGTR